MGIEDSLQTWGTPARRTKVRARWDRFTRQYPRPARHLDEEPLFTEQLWHDLFPILENTPLDGAADKMLKFCYAHPKLGDKTKVNGRKPFLGRATELPRLAEILFLETNDAVSDQVEAEQSLAKIMGRPLAAQKLLLGTKLLQNQKYLMWATYSKTLSRKPWDGVNLRNSPLRNRLGLGTPKKTRSLSKY